MGARGPKPTPAHERVMAKVVVDENGCWIYTGYVNPDTGYGQVFTSKLDGRRTNTCHVVMWVAENGSVPEGLELDHLCRVRACCRPAHCEPVTHAENVRRGLHGTGVQYGGLPPQGWCRKGLHRLEGANIIERAAGRLCRTCRNDYRRERRLTGLVA